MAKRKRKRRPPHLALKIAITAAELTQADVATVLRVSPFVMCRWCSGETLIPAYHAIKLASMLRISPRDLMY